jgi:menaquinone-dependent protoporphyrinogen IX oxidase
MKNLRFLIDKRYEADSIAKDLQLQLEINRFNHVNVTAVDQRNEVIVQVPEENGSLEEAIESFMENYQNGIILE